MMKCIAFMFLEMIPSHVVEVW